MEILLGILIIIAVVILIFGYNAVAWGYVISVLWGWFVIPVFPQAPHLGVMEAIGLSLVIGALTYKHTPSSKCKEDEEKKKKNEYSDVISLILAPWIALFVGWVVTLFY